MEDELIRRAAKGDQQAFRKLVETYALVVERTAVAVAGDASIAEDGGQGAWLDAWRALPRFELGRPFRPWLLVIVANRARKQKRRFVPTLTKLNIEMLSSKPVELASSPWAWPHADDAIGRAMSKLNHDQQQVLALRYFADLELEEIALLTKVPLGTVKSRLHRALQAVRKHLQTQREHNWSVANDQQAER